MFLIDKLRKDFVQYRKDRNDIASKLLSLVISEADKIGKSNGCRKPTDTESIQVIKKMINSNQEMINIFKDSEKRLKKRDGEGDLSTTLNKIKIENEILNNYIPKQMNEKEIYDTIDLIIVEEGLEDIKSLGLVMSIMKREHEGLYDGKIASTIAREILLQRERGE